MKSDAPCTITFGPAHRVVFEPPDLVVLTLDGPMELEHVTAMYDVFEDIAGGQPLLILNDMSRTTGPTSKARRLAAYDPRVKLLGAQAVVRAPFHTRIIVSMLETAARVFQGKTTPTQFFDDEASARAWLATQRPLVRPT